MFGPNSKFSFLGIVSWYKSGFQSQPRKSRISMILYEKFNIFCLSKFHFLSIFWSNSKFYYLGKLSMRESRFYLNLPALESLKNCNNIGICSRNWQFLNFYILTFGCKNVKM